MAKKKPATHGGARKGAGRPRLPADQKRDKYTVWLTAAEADFLQRRGGVSEGVQALISQAKSG